jgi:hypothetical protein
MFPRREKTATMEKIFYAVRAEQLQSENFWGSVVVSCCREKLVADAGDSSGTQRKGNVGRWKPLSSNGREDVTVDTSDPIYSHTVIT